MARYMVLVYLQSFLTKISGDTFKKGEFYFKCNGKRYPDKGDFHLAAGGLFNPNPPPTFYTAIMDDSDKTINFDLEVWEADPGLDDKFIDHQMKLNIAPLSETYEITDKQQRCTLKIVVQIFATDKW